MPHPRSTWFPTTLALVLLGAGAAAHAQKVRVGFVNPVFIAGSDPYHPTAEFLTHPAGYRNQFKVRVQLDGKDARPEDFLWTLEDKAGQPVHQLGTIRDGLYIPPGFALSSHILRLRATLRANPQVSGTTSLVLRAHPQAGGAAKALRPGWSGLWLVLDHKNLYGVSGAGQAILLVAGQQIELLTQSYGELSLGHLAVPPAATDGHGSVICYFYEDISHVVFRLDGQGPVARIPGNCFSNIKGTTNKTFSRGSIHGLAAGSHGELYASVWSVSYPDPRMRRDRTRRTPVASCLRRWDPVNGWTTLAGKLAEDEPVYTPPELRDGVGAEARFALASSLALDEAGGKLYVRDLVPDKEGRDDEACIRVYDLDTGAVTTPKIATAFEYAQRIRFQDGKLLSLVPGNRSSRPSQLLVLDLKTGQVEVPYADPDSDPHFLRPGPCPGAAPGLEPRNCGSLGFTRGAFDLDGEGRIAFGNLMNLGLLILDRGNPRAPLAPSADSKANSGDRKAD
jgi:hypothetical protein